MPSFTLCKEERICKRTETERLFSGNSRRITVFPIRAVFTETEREIGAPWVKMMVSVPKKCFKRAVKRNRVKRQLREAYRHLKHYFSALKTESGTTLLVAFVWMDNKLYASEEVKQRMEKLICRICEKY
ncbi:MAG: ribonuclease P protein component [Prevotella sp.]|nr:ribonuclease P protein component [Prevotella sp.]